MSKLSDLFPQNLAIEYKRFTANPEYNPQFTYLTAIDESFLTKWGTPHTSFLSVADHVIQQWQTHNDSPSETSIYDQQRIGDAVDTYFFKMGDIPKPPIRFNPNQISRCQVTKEGIIFRPHLIMSDDDFEGLLRHEIGGHYIRRVNHKSQTWSSLKNDDQGRTEEGVALLHTFLFHPKPSLIKSALRYRAAWLGQTHSFSQVYAQLRHQGVSHREAWRATLRTKRGLTDTSQPKTFTKDIMYLEGIMKVLRWLKNKENQAYNLYQGQISLEQLEILELRQPGELYIPDFILDHELYYQQIESLISYNNLGDIL